MTATLIACFALFAGAESVTPEIKIGYCNLSFADNIRIKYAVGSNVDGVDLLVWRSLVSDYVYGTQDDVLTYSYTENIGGVVHYIFDFDEFSAKNMTDYVYTRAHVKVGDVDYYSDVNKYSILQYAQNMIAKSSDQKLIKLLTKMLEYGAAVQEYHGYKTDRLATASWYSVKLTAGSLPDGTREGLYLTGETVILTAPDKDGTKSFSHWIDSEGKKVSSPVSVGKKNETYTPVYVNYSTGLTYVSNGDGTCYVSGIGTCTDTEIIIPPTSPEGDSVTSIGGKAFYNCTSLTSITIPDSVKSIGDYAFEGCTGITEITIPESVTSIGTQIFFKATNLTTVYYYSSYYSSDNPLLSTGRINKVVFKSLTNINSILKQCSNINEVVLEDGIKSIGYQAFYYCTNLTSITIPDSVTSIGERAFSGCTSLASITIPDSVTSIGKGAFEGCTSLASITIPDSVMSIGEWAFHDCTSLVSITIPDSVTSIGDAAFWNCTNLKTVNYTGDIESWLKISFSSSSSNPCCNGASLYFGGELVTDVVVPDTITKINNYAFSGCTSLASITIPDSVTSIGYQAFYYCTNLASITIPDSVTSIGYEAFYNCKSLTSITIPDSVTSIGSYAFYNCTNLTSITIPDSVTSIDRYAFNGCTSLAKVYYGGTADQWSGINIGGYNYDLIWATRYYYSETEPTESGYYWHYVDEIPTAWSMPLKLSYTINSDGESCTITGIVVNTESNLIIPSRIDGYTVTKIGSDAFEYEKSFTEVVIPDSVTSIGSSAFWNCTRLAKVYYGGTAARWSGMYIDSYNSKLTNATRYYYSETEPTTTGKYWHYVDGVVTEW